MNNIYAQIDRLAEPGEPPRDKLIGPEFSLVVGFLLTLGVGAMALATTLWLSYILG